MQGYSTYGAYATAVLRAVMTIRETPVGDKTALARDLVESELGGYGSQASVCIETLGDSKILIRGGPRGGV